MTRRSTIGDVATAAGVSVATVSRVLNGGAVRAATATKVREAAASLEYTPNALTRSIFAGRSSTIGVVIRDLNSPFSLNLIRGIDEVAAANGSLVMFANTFRDLDREVAHVRTMDEQRVRGLIVTTSEATDTKTRRMAETGTPCVIVARTVPDPPPGLHTVSLDNLEAGTLMATHLKASGRTNVAILSSGPQPSPQDRTQGIRDLYPQAPEATAETEQDVDAAVASLLTTAPDAIVCTTGRLTVATHTAMTTRGLTIPRDIAFLTMDEFPWSNALGITVVAQPSYDMGRHAANLVVTNPPTPTQRTFPPTLHPRTSCGEPS